MRDFGPGWTLLYNGPKCGASAPFHLHFQVVPSGQMPIEKKIQDPKRVRLVKHTDGVRLYRGIGLGREAVLLEGNGPAVLKHALKQYLDTLKKVLDVSEEPMVNILGLQKAKGRQLVVFPRQRHRPEAFFKQGEARMVVSPGAIDMGGVLIAPIQRDFERLDAAAVEGIYGEVSLEKDAAKEVIEILRKGS
jgi:hypothetical protein